MDMFSKAPDNTAQIAAANKQAAEAKERETKAKMEQKKEQEEIIEGNKARRRSAFSRFSLLSVGDTDKKEVLG